MVCTLRGRCIYRRVLSGMFLCVFNEHRVSSSISQYNFDLRDDGESI